MCNIILTTKYKYIYIYNLHENLLNDNWVGIKLINTEQMFKDRH